MKKIYFYLLICFLGTFVSAQQDEQSSLYMFNPLQYNPAYAGTKQTLNITGIARSQWVGLNGAPTSQFLSAHSPLTIKNMALGIQLTNDKIGARSRTGGYLSYAYTLHFKNHRKLNLGLSGGGEQMVVNFQQLIANDPTETDYLASFSQFNFNAGIGAYYHSDNFYLGMSVPRLLHNKLSNNGILLSDDYVRNHYFFSAGYVRKINSTTDLKGSVLIKMTENAPLTMDLNLNLFFYKTFWAGIMYRYHESIGANVMYQWKEQWSFGYAYDYPINGLNTVRNGGSHEIMLNYTLNKKNQGYGSPRYF